MARERRRPKRSGSAAAAAPPVTPPLAEAAATRAAWALAAAHVVLALVRAAAPYAPGAYAWSLAAPRFLPPALGWSAWALVALALVPPLGERAAAALEAAGRARERRPARGALAFGACAAAIAWALPDRTRFVGDFLLRQGSAEIGLVPERVWPQALPLDAFLHSTVPIAFDRARLGDPNLVARAMDAIEAALLGGFAFAFARSAGAKGALLVAGAGVATFGGAFALFAGYGKAFTELVVAIAAIGAFGVRVARGEGGALGLGVATALAVLLHRSGPLVLPAVAFAYHAGGRANPALARERRAWAGIAIAGAALAASAAKTVRLVATYDRVHYAPPEVAAAGGPFAAAFAGVRAVDAPNLVLHLAPVLPAALAALLAMGRDVPRRREGAFLALLALPWVAMIPFVHPVNGLARDWDVFAMAGAGLGLACAWIVIETLRGAPRFAWLAPATLLAVLVPTVLGMALDSDDTRGVARAEALANGPPRRSDAERARLWDFVGTRYNQLERWEPSVLAFRRAVETSPSPRMLLQLATSENLAGHLPEAIAAYHAAFEKEPKNWAALLGLAAAASRIPDYGEVRWALDRLLEIRPGDRNVIELKARVEAEEAARKAGLRPEPALSPLVVSREPNPYLPRGAAK